MPTLRRNSPIQSLAQWLSSAMRQVSVSVNCSGHVVVLAATVLTCVMPAGALAREALTLTRQDGQSTVAMVYRPQIPGCRGIAMISPGAGGSEQGYTYLGEGLSSFGYLALVMGHQESGRQAMREYVQRKGLREGLGELITNASAYRGRFMDIAAARQWARSRCEGPEQILVGHSMGAASVMIEAGARNKLALTGADAFDAYVALSPQGSGLIFPAQAWSALRRPVLSITGTRDTELGGGSWETRTEPFREMAAGCKWLAVFDGATHMNLAGIAAPPSLETKVVQVMGAFLDGARRNDCTLGAQADGLVIESK
jgi:dienelactone hydrolase